MKIAKRDLEKLINEELGMLSEVDSYSLANYVMSLLGEFTRTGGLRKHVASLVIGTVYHIDSDLARALEDDINKNPRFLDSSAPRTVTENKMKITKRQLISLIREAIDKEGEYAGIPSGATVEQWENVKAALQPVLKDVMYNFGGHADNVVKEVLDALKLLLNDWERKAWREYIDERREAYASERPWEHN